MDSAHVNKIIRCLWTFVPNRSDELELHAGSTIRILYAPTQEWWFGECLESGKIGWFPAKYAMIPNGSALYRLIFGSSKPSVERRRFELAANSIDEINSLLHGNYTHEPKIVEIPSHSFHQPLAEFNTAMEWKSSKNILVCRFRKWAFGMSKRNLKLITHTYDFWTMTMLHQLMSLLVPDYSSNKRTVKIRRTDTEPSSRSSLAVQWHEICPEVVKQALDSKEFKRQNAIFEFIQTERDFIRDMRIVFNLFIDPMKKEQILTGQEMHKLFSNLEIIVPVNIALLEGLESCYINNHLVGPVGPTLRKMANFFKIYADYCSNYPESLIFLETCQKKKFKAFIQEQYKNPEMRFMTLGSFLIKPIQRICKYPLLINDILRNTCPNNVDAIELQEAMKTFEHVVSIVNEGAKQAESFHRVVEVASSFTEKLDIIEPSRRLIKEGNLVRVEEKRGKYFTHKIRFFLFNDLLIIGRKKKKNSYSVIVSLPLDEVLISPVAKANTIFTEDEKLSCFVLIVNSLTKWNLKCKSAQERNIWMELIGKFHVNSKRTLERTTSVYSKDGKLRIRKESTLNLAGNAIRRPQSEISNEKRWSRLIPSTCLKNIASSPRFTIATTSPPKVELVTSKTSIKDLVKKFESQ